MNCSEGCSNAAVMLGLPGVRVLQVDPVFAPAAVPQARESDEGPREPAEPVAVGLRLLVETTADMDGCRACGVLAQLHDRVVVELVDAPFGHRQVVLRWRKRVWRCPERRCPVRTWTETCEVLAPPRALLSSRAVMWATDEIADDDATVSALAHRLGVSWKTLWRAVRREAQRRVEDPARLDGVSALGVDEHVWRPGRFGAGRDVTGMVKLRRDQDGRLHAELLDLVLGRSGGVYSTWLSARTPAFRAGVKQAALDPFRGYANALRDTLPDAVQVLDAFHVVKLGTQVVDEVRRRVQQEQLGRRGHKDDPLFKIRGLMRHGVENLTDKQQARLSRCLAAGDPDKEVELAWSCYQQLRAVYSGRQPPAARRRLAEKVLDSFHTCPIPEVARLGRTLRSWRAQVLAYFDTGGLSNGGTEAINGLIEKTRRLAHGFRNFENYRLRCLLAADGRRGTRRAQVKPPSPR